MGRDKHLDCIDGIKGLGACIIAFLWHYQHFIMPPDVPLYRIFPVLYENGYIFVELFFLLSGFGMMFGYGNRIIEKQISFSSYIKRRISKIYPLFLLSTFMVIPFQVLIHYSTGHFFVYPNFDLYHFILNMLLLQNGALETGWSFNSPSWVISVLMMLYTAFYVICYHANNKRIVYYIMGIGALLGSIIILTGYRVRISIMEYVDRPRPFMFFDRRFNIRCI